MRHLAPLIGLMILSIDTPAAARRGGIVVSGCEACHGSSGAEIELAVTPADFGPNTDVTFTVTVGRPAGATTAAGLYVVNPGVGELRALEGEGLTSASGFGLTHEQPKPANGDVVTFRFGWRAPPTRGAVQLDVFGISANGDDRSTGDVAGRARFRAAFGCTGTEVYVDFDRDGFGDAAFGTGFGCAGAPPPVGYAAETGDCAENDAQIHPLALERCNRKDDDCDGEVDENAVPIELWPDEDGDGYAASASGTPVMGCVGMPGYAAEFGDCAPGDPSVHPGASEVCNFRDDNCDGRDDEGARPRCGVGSCVTESPSCDPADCVPRRVSAETCNLSDDDCDGETDEGELCAAGQSCLAGNCVNLGDEPAGSGGSSSSGGSSAGSGASRGSGVASSGGSQGSGSNTGAGSDPGSPTDLVASGGGCALPAAPGRPRPLPSIVLGLALALAATRRRASIR